MRRQPSFTRADRLQSLMLDEVERLVSYEVRSPLAQKVKVVASRLSPDLGHLRVMYVMLDGSDATDAVQDVLEKASAFVARNLVEALDLSKWPQVVFQFDADAQRSRRVEQILAAERARTVANVADSDPAVPKPTDE